MLTSDWELDRITAYLLWERRARGTTTQQEHDPQDAQAALAAARRELDLVRATAKPRLMPLHYSLRWARAAVPSTNPQLAADARDLATAIEDSVTKKNLDPGGQIRELLSELRARASATYGCEDQE
jgi:3-deoxy-D-arabino-heptulosonate 7-phosphate (DAHP) synthase class II